MRPKEFEDFLKERFGMDLPKSIQLSRDKGSAIRIYSTSLNSIELRGSRGFVVHSKKTGISNDFIQMFGHLGKKNKIELNEDEALDFAFGEKIRKKIFLKKGPIIVCFKNHVIGVGMFDGRFLHSKVKGKRRRGMDTIIGVKK